MLLLLGSTILLSALSRPVAGQCDLLPDGTTCNPAANGDQYPDPDNCAMYYECQDGCAQHLLCERNFLFDTKFGYCNYPLDVDCGDRPCTNNEHCLTTVSTTTVTTTEDCGHPQDCFELGEGYHPDPYNCRKYWHCVAGRSEHKICPEDQLYEPDKVWCNFADLVSCGDRPICDECDGNCITQSPPPPPTTDCGHIMDCSDKEDGYYADPFNCRKYWHCFAGEGAHLTCEGNLLYDPVNVWCNYPEQVECGDRPICGPCDEDCQTTTVPCDHQMDCSAFPDGWYPDPYNCRKYWHCEHGSGQHYVCKDNLLYDPDHKWCDFPSSVDCGERPVCDDCDSNCQ